MHKYQELMGCIHVPEGLDEQVLAAAEQKVRQRGRQGRAVLRGAVCAACALTLVLGSFSLRWEKEPGGAASGNLVLNYEFGLMASATDRGVNGGVVFRWEGDCGSFRITGGDITSVCLEVNRGTLLRDGKVMGSSISENYDGSTVYAIAPVDGDTMESLDGAVITLEVTFPDGSTKNETYCLTTENLRAFQNEDGQEVLVPALEGDSSETVPALYAAGADSRWLGWPVSGSNTVSLSQPFGERSYANAKTAFHAGIDIPGEQGMDIGAAAGGVVIETGYDAERGNYLILDHGSGLTSLYGQCQELLAAEGDSVEAGQTIALLGSTGMSTGPHLHFEVRQDGEAQNPVAYFDSAVRDLLRAE